MVEVGLAETDVMSEHVDNYLGGPVALPGTGRPGPWTRQTPPAGSGAAATTAPTVTGDAAAPTPGRGAGRGFAPDPVAREALRKWRLTVPWTVFVPSARSSKTPAPILFPQPQLP